MRRIGDLHAMVHGVALLEPAQDRDGVLDTGLADVYFLKTPLQCGVLLDVFAIFIERGRANAVQLAARQRRLEHIARVHRAFGLAGTHYGVQLVDEKNDIAFFLGQILEHGLEPLLEFATKLRAGDQRAHVERQHTPATQALRYFTVDDALREAFDDRSLAHAGFADQHRIVLGAPLQHLDHATDFLVAADDRIELGFLRTRGQINRVFFQRLTLLLRVLVFHFFAAAHFFDGGFKRWFACTRSFQRRTEFAFIVNRGEHE